ncbi:hypothetical protein RHGRI_037738 [Rhododendron griersonianum]|uniref:Uncharacterized protein n=1 Tax=Rhododendron griersonianum TaxID=479676 RepID=A0AAV6HSU6_9ERIC|nr:hypothetical protein RHGRI_037738 [Rhododendron griersonianum]
MTIRYWDALSFQSIEDVQQQVDTLVFGHLDDGLEIHLVDGQFVFNNGDLVFDDHEDEAPAPADVGRGGYLVYIWTRF